MEDRQEEDEDVQLVYGVRRHKGHLTLLKKAVSQPTNSPLKHEGTPLPPPKNQPCHGKISSYLRTHGFTVLFLICPEGAGQHCVPNALWYADLLHIVLNKRQQQGDEPENHQLCKRRKLRESQAPFNYPIFIHLISIYPLHSIPLQFGAHSWCSQGPWITTASPQNRNLRPVYCLPCYPSSVYALQALI